MTPVLIVVMLVAGADADDVATRSARASTEAALGPTALIVVRELAAPPTDAEVTSLEGTLHADAAVEIDWLDATHDHARVRVHDGSTATWSEREIGFSDSDPPVERGRAIALVVASMMPAPKPPATPTPTPAPAPAATVATSAPPSPPYDVASLGENRREHAAVDVSGLASPSSLDASFGGAIGARFFLVPGLAWHVAGGARFGSVAAAGATLGTTMIGTGFAWTAWSHEFLSLDLRADVWALRHVLSEPGGPSSDARWVGAASLLLEPAAVLTPGGATLVLGAGIEQSFAAIDLVVDDRRVASLPRTRPIVELGIRARF